MANRFLSNIRINDAYTFPASDGSNGQFIKTDGSGNLSFADPSASSSASVIYRDNFTGDGSTVVFDLQNSLTTEDQSFIYIDGVYQEKDTYSLSSTQITFTTAPISGHSIEVISIAGINTGPTVIYQDNFTGNGSSTDFTLAQVIDNEVKTFVFLNGVYQFKGTYTVDSTTLSFDTAPANGVDIEVISIASAVQTDSLEAGAVIIPVKNTHTASIAKGTPVYITGNVGSSERLQIAPADASNSAKMPAAGLLLTTLAVNAEGYVITGGYLRNLTTDTIDGTSTSSNDTVYVKPGGGLTMTKPTGSNLIQNIAKVARSASANAGSLLVSSILRTNDVPNLTTGKIWVGSANNTIESGTLHLDESNNRLGINNNSPNYSLDVTGDANISSNVIIGGNLTVDGTQTILNTQTVEVEDNILQLNTTQGSPDTATATTSGISIYRGDGVTQASFIFDDGDDTWDLTNNLVVAGNSTVGGNVTTENIFQVYSTGVTAVIGAIGNTANDLNIYSTTTGHNGLRMHVNGILPTDNSGTIIDNDADLGDPNYRFKNLYLAGDGTFGGSVGIGAAPSNKLHIQQAKSGSSAENYDLLRFNLTGTGAIGDSSSIVWYSTSGTKTAGIEGISGQDNILYGELAFNVRKYTTDSFDEVMRINNRGNVGIGTTLPQVPLQIGTHLTTAPADTGLCVSNRKSIRINDADGSYNFGVYIKQNYSGTSYLILGTRHNGTDTDGLIVKNGNVGIGTGEYAQKPLDISGPTGGQVLITGANDAVGTTAGILFRAEGGEANSLARIKGGIFFERIAGSFGNGDLKFAVNTSVNNDAVTVADTKMTIDSSGNVGIGYTSPSSFNQRVNAPHLVVGSGSNASGVTIFSGTNDQGSINFADGTTTTDQYTGGIVYVHGLNNYMSFHTNGGTERMRIDSSGNILIGTASATSSSKVTIQAQGADGSDETALVLRNYSSTPYTGYVTTEYEVGTTLMAEISAYRLNSTSGELIFRTKQSGTITDAMRIDSSGNVGISNTNPSSYYANANNLVVGSHTGSNGISILSATNSTGWLIFADSTAGGDNTRGAIAYDHSTNSMSMRVNNDTKMLIDSSGNVGISYTGPYNQISGGETTLAIADAENAALYLKSNAAGGHNHILFSGTGGALSFYDKTRGDYNMVIDVLET